MTGHRTVRIACVGLLAIAVLVAGSASSSAAQNLVVSISGPATNPTAGNGSPFELTVQTTNNDTGDSAAVTTTLSLPSGVTLDGTATPPGSNCAPVGTGTVQCARPAITAGSSDTFKVDLQADHTVHGVVHVLGSSSDGSLTSNTADDSVMVDTSADLALSDAATPASSQGVTPGDAVAGGSISYALTVDNSTGPSDNQGFTVRDTLPVGATLSAPVSGCSVSTPANGSHGDVVDCVHSGALAAGTGSSVTYTLPVAVSASQPAASSYSDSAAIIATSTTDPNGGNDSASDPVNLVTRSDLALTESAAVPTGTNYEPSTQNDMVVAGDTHAFSYTLTVTNGGPSDNQGFVVQDVLPHGASFNSAGSTAGCVVTAPGDAVNGDTVQCTESSVTTPAGHPSFTIAATTASSEPANATYTDAASIFSTQTVDPNNANDTNSHALKLVERANLTLANFAVSPVQTPLYANSNPAQNTVAYTFTVANGGPSDGHAVIVTSTLEAGKLVGASYGWCVDPCVPSSSQPYPSGGKLSVGTGGTVPNGQTIDVVVTATADASLRSGPKNGSESVVAGFGTTSATQDYDLSDNSAADSPGVVIDTVPTPAQNPFAIPGTGNAILTWENPAGNGGQAIQNFLITVTPPVGSSFTLPTVPFNASPTGKCGAVNASDCYQLTVTGLQNDNGAYSFGIQAQNAVGPSDAATTSATPSVNAKNASVPTNTSTTLTTCTTATPTTQVCVVYSIPSGAGGVFGAGGLVALPTGLCGINVTCINNTGAQNLGSLAGYNDRTHPLIETITWDSSLIAPSFYTHVPACPNNSTRTDCYPNNIPIYYEDTFSLLHCGVGFPGTCDPNTLVNHSLFPVVPGTVLNTHFCALAAPNGAGNKNYARPKPSPLGVYNGYNDPSGSACIKSMNALGSASQNGANRDIQVVINMTSDSDGLAGRH